MRRVGGVLQPRGAEDEQGNRYTEHARSSRAVIGIPAMHAAAGP